MRQRIEQCQSYDSALSIISDYVNITSVMQVQSMDMVQDKEDTPMQVASEYL